MPYGEFVHRLIVANIKLDRKILSQLAMSEPFSFQAIVQQVKDMKGLQASDSAKQQRKT